VSGQPSTEAAVQYSVVRIIARLNVGGPAWHVIHLNGASARYPTLVVTGAVDPGEADMTGEAVRRGVVVHRIPELGRRLHPAQDLVAFVKLVRLLRRVRPRIVHTHTAKAGVVGRLAAVVAGVPVRVHTFHGHVFHGYFSAAATRVFLAIERALARLTTRIVALSEGQATELSEHYRIAPRERITVVPLGLELDRFVTPDAPASAAARAAFRSEVGAGHRPVVSSIGRLVPIKNHRLLLEAVAILQQRNLDAVFVLAGGGPEEGALRRDASALGIAERVRFLGWRTDLEAIYAGSDAVVLASDNEGTPVCLLEAMAAGVPVVSTDAGGVPDIMRGRGVVVPRRDPEALANALAAVLADPPAPSERARVSREVRAGYGAGRLVHDMTNLYDGLLARAARAVPVASN
jgi:glycosyltransferase involved in cell wall biosynthesis